MTRPPSLFARQRHSASSDSSSRQTVPSDLKNPTGRVLYSVDPSDRLGDHRCPLVSGSLVSEERPEPCGFTCHLLFAPRMTIFIPRHDEQPRGVFACLLHRLGWIGLGGEQVPAERAFGGLEERVDGVPVLGGKVGGFTRDEMDVHVWD